MLHVLQPATYLRYTFLLHVPSVCTACDLVAATSGYDMSGNMSPRVDMILSLHAHVSATRPCYMSPPCVLHVILSLLHVAAACPGNKTLRVWAPLRSSFHISASSRLSEHVKMLRVALFTERGRMLRILLGLQIIHSLCFSLRMLLF